METNSKTAEVLNDLIRINNDRIDGYEKAVETVENIDVDLKGIFRTMANQSRDNVSELSREVLRLGSEVATGTTGSGKIYRVWMDIKATFWGNDRESALESCEYGEDAALEAYEDALASDAEMTTEIRQLITDQKASLRQSHNTIKKYRDLQKAVAH